MSGSGMPFYLKLDFYYSNEINEFNKKGFGSFAIPPLAHYLLNNYEWRFAFIVFACLILQCCVLGALFRPVPMRLKAMYIHEFKSNSPNFAKYPKF